MNPNFLHDIETRTGAKEWFTSIPSIIKQLEKSWVITVGDPFDLSYNYVAPAIKNNYSVVLKIVFPGNNEFFSEISALQAYEGQGSVKLIDLDNENHAMLLERAIPGERLSNLERDEEATKILSEIIKKLWKSAPPKHDLQPVSDLINDIPEFREQFPGAKNPLPQEILDKTQETLNMLIHTTQKQVVLHGDLHQGNVLSASREPWLAIDPKGFVGDPVFETGAMMRNPYGTLMQHPSVKEILTRRIQILSSELELDAERIRQWSFVQTVLSVVYRIEDHGDSAWHHAFEVAKVLDSIKIG